MNEYFMHPYALTQNLRTLIQDQDGKKVFLLAGRRGNLNDEISLYKISGEYLGKIRQTSVFFGNRFELYLGNEKVATMTKIFKVPKNYYYIKDVNWMVTGDIINHEYKVTTVAIKKMMMAMSNVTTLEGEMLHIETVDCDATPLCILIATVLDSWSYLAKKEKKLKVLTELLKTPQPSTQTSCTQQMINARDE